MIQPLAYIHGDAKIAQNVVIEPFTTISKNVEIGEGTWIGSNVTIMEGARIGKNCKIFPGAVISAVPQDLKFDGEESLAIVGDNTVLRECVTINRGTKDRKQTIVGSNCLIMAYSHVAHDCIVGDHCIMANSVHLAGHVSLGNYVIIGGNSGVHQFVHIGDHSFIGAGTIVRKDIPPFVKAAREPLSFIGINSVGLRRRGYDLNQINHIQDIYRILFVRGYTTSKAIRIIEAEIPASEERDEILTFIKDARRGIMKGFNQKNDNHS